MSKKRDGIAEILASGRCPGFRVSGSGRAPLQVPHLPYISGGSPNPEHKRRADQRNWEEKRRVAKETNRLAGKVDGGIRHVASVPFQVDAMLRKQHGEDYRGSEMKKIQKDHGFRFEND